MLGLSHDTIALIATILVSVIGGILYSGQQIALVNKRIDDLRDTMDVRFKAVDKRIDDLRVEIRDGFAEIRTDIRVLAEALRARA